MDSRKIRFVWGALVMGALATSSLRATEEGQPLDLQPIHGLKQLEIERREQSLQVERFIPAHRLSEGDSLQDLSRRILEQTARTLVRESSLSRSTIVQSVENFGESLSGELYAKVPVADESDYAPRPIEHNLSFRLRADQGRAFLRYRGLTEAELTFSLFGQAIRFQVNEQLTSKLELLFIYEISHEDVLYEVNLSWAW